MTSVNYLIVATSLKEIAWSSSPFIISADIPIIPPINIIKTNVEGTVHIARPPICALTIPTLTIARKWSIPKTGWEMPS